MRDKSIPFKIIRSEWKMC